MIVSLNREKCLDVAKLHASILPNDFLPKLGLEFLHRFYLETILVSGGDTYTYIDSKGRIKGFIVLSENSDLFLKKIIRKNLFYFSMLFLKKCRKFNYLIFGLELLKNILFNSTKIGSEISSEIIFIGVEKNSQGQGIGKKLLKKVDDYFKPKSVEIVKTKVNVLNRNANNFYLNKNYKSSEVFKITGNKWKYYFIPVNGQSKNDY